MHNIIATIQVSAFSLLKSCIISEQRNYKMNQLHRTILHACVPHTFLHHIVASYNSFNNLRDQYWSVPIHLNWKGMFHDSSLLAVANTEAEAVDEIRDNLDAEHATIQCNMLCVTHERLVNHMHRIM